MASVPLFFVYNLHLDDNVAVVFPHRVLLNTTIVLRNVEEIRFVLLLAPFTLDCHHVLLPI